MDVPLMGCSSAEYSTSSEVLVFVHGDMCCLRTASVDTSARYWQVRCIRGQCRSLFDGDLAIVKAGPAQIEGGFIVSWRLRSIPTTLIDKKRATHTATHIVHVGGLALALT